MGKIIEYGIVERNDKWIALDIPATYPLTVSARPRQLQGHDGWPTAPKVVTINGDTQKVQIDGTNFEIQHYNNNNGTCSLQVKSTRNATNVFYYDWIVNGKTLYNFNYDGHRYDKGVGDWDVADTQVKRPWYEYNEDRTTLHFGYMQTLFLSHYDVYYKIPRAPAPDVDWRDVRAIKDLTVEIKTGAFAGKYRISKETALGYWYSSGTKTALMKLQKQLPNGTYESQKYEMACTASDGTGEGWWPEAITPASRRNNWVMRGNGTSEQINEILIDVVKPVNSIHEKTTIIPNTKFVVSNTADGKLNIGDGASNIVTFNLPNDGTRINETKKVLFHHGVVEVYIDAQSYGANNFYIFGFEFRTPYKQYVTNPQQFGWGGTKTFEVGDYLAYRTLTLSADTPAK